MPEENKGPEVFTELVAALAAGDPSLDRDTYDEVVAHLRAILIREMRRRGLWTAPPAYLGVSAHSWRDHGALDELVTDAYLAIFVDRLRGLIDQQADGKTIYGLVVRNVRHFLTDRQRKGDPVGYRVFSRLRKAVEGLVERGQLLLRVFSPQGDGRSKNAVTPRIGNAAVLAFAEGEAPVAERRLLERVVPRWNASLMPDLVLAEGRAVPKVVDATAERVMTLPEDGVEAFRFGDAVGALKRDARGRWQSVWRQGQDLAPEDGSPGAAEVPVTRPDGLGSWCAFQAAVLVCVERTLDAVRPPKRRRDLWSLWLFVRGARIDVARRQDVQALPSYSAIARAIALPRERVAQLLAELKRFVRACADGGAADAPDVPSTHRPSQKTPPDVQASRPRTPGRRER